MKTLKQISAEKPYPEFQEWWPMGASFTGMMSSAILQACKENLGSVDKNQVPAEYMKDYIRTVYQREMRPYLPECILEQDFTIAIQSGEFDAFSYAYYRSAFETIDRENDPKGQRAFTIKVGKIFFEQMALHLQLNIPDQLKTAADFSLLKNCLSNIGEFLKREGYLRDSFGFAFDVNINYRGSQLKQKENEFLPIINHQRIGYALYSMGYPVILPSAVYLYHTKGEAQHHSSRTIEELFLQAGCEARETDDFDPTDFPANEVVELWEIRKIPTES